MTSTIQIKRGTRSQVEAAKTSGTLLQGEPYLITDENRLGVGTSASSYSSFATKEEVEAVPDKKVAVTPVGDGGYLWNTDGTDGVIRTNSSLTITKDINDSFIQLAVADVDFGTF